MIISLLVLLVIAWTGAVLVLLTMGVFVMNDAPWLGIMLVILSGLAFAALVTFGTTVADR